MGTGGMGIGTATGKGIVKLFFLQVDTVDTALFKRDTDMGIQKKGIFCNIL